MGAIRSLTNRCMLMEQGRLVDFDATEKVISRYLCGGDYGNVVDIDDSMRMRGGQLVRFTRCAISGTDDTPMNLFCIGEDIKLSFDLDSELEGEVSCWMYVKDSSGTPILNNHQKDVSTVHLDRGAYKVVVETRGLGLMPGRYTISAGLVDKKKQLIEWVEDCQAFDVSPSFISGAPFDGRLGQVHVPAEWSVERG